MHLERFINIITHEFEISVDLLKPDSYLVGDLDFDSFDFLRMMLICEALSPGFEPPDDLDFSSIKVIDVYELLFGGVP